MELPLWLAKGLYEKKRRVVSMELPKVYREGWRTVFNADPTVVDLHKMGPYYYGLGSQMLHFDSPENPEIAQALLQVSGEHTRVMPKQRCCFPVAFIKSCHVEYVYASVGLFPCVMAISSAYNNKTKLWNGSDLLWAQTKH